MPETKDDFLAFVAIINASYTQDEICALFVWSDELVARHGLPMQPTQK